jgi:hypothetical protein
MHKQWWEYGATAGLTKTLICCCVAVGERGCCICGSCTRRKRNNLYPKYIVYSTYDAPYISNSGNEVHPRPYNDSNKHCSAAV